MTSKLLLILLASLSISSTGAASVNSFAQREVNRAASNIVEIRGLYLKGELSQAEFGIHLRKIDASVRSVALAVGGMKGIELESRRFMSESRAEEIMAESKAEVLQHYLEPRKIALHGVDRTT